MNTTQGNQSVTQYFTKITTVREELNDYRPLIQYECGGAHRLQQFVQTEFIMAFLMGLNETLSQTRGQILLMDLIPPIDLVFSLILQEEHQQLIGSQSSTLVSVCCGSCGQ